MIASSLVDIGINLAHDSYDADRAAVISRAHEAGVTQMVVTGSSVASSQSALQMALAYPRVLFATAGIHPHHATDLTEDAVNILRELTGHTTVVAVGECGLDYFRDLSPRAAQRLAFQRQLELAAAAKKPVFLHQRAAHEDFMAILREYRPSITNAVAHCFTGTREELVAYLELDLSIGITGWICDERRGAHLLPLMREIPEERLMLETDGPYLLPRDLPTKPQSRRNEPRFLPHIAATVARARGASLESIAAATTRNARQFFGLPMVSVV